MGLLEYEDNALLLLFSMDKNQANKKNEVWHIVNIISTHKMIPVVIQHTVCEKQSILKFEKMN